MQPFPVTQEDLPRLRVLKPDAGPETSLAARLALGNECWAVKSNEEWMFSQWLTINLGTSPIDLGTAASAPPGMLLRPGQMYFWDAWCAPSCRNHGLGRKTKSWLIRHYSSLGVKEAVVLILPFNHASRRSVRAVGFQYSRLRLELKMGREPSR